MAKNDNKKKVVSDPVQVNDGIVPEVKKDEIEPSELMAEVKAFAEKFEAMSEHDVREVALAAQDCTKHLSKVLGLARFIDSALNPKKYAKK